MSLRSGFQLGEWAVYPLEGRLTGAGRERRVQPKSMDVLLCLAEQAEIVVERDELLRQVWGDRAQSDEPLTRCIGELRRALGDDRANPRYIQTIPKRGYQLIQPVVPFEPEPPDQDFALPESKPPKFLLLAVALLAVVLTLLATTYWRSDRGEGQAEDPLDADSEPLPDDLSIVVLPFENLSGDDDQAYISDGISEELLNRLARIPNLRVISRTSAFSFRDSSLDLPSIAKQLQVRHVLEGSVRLDGDRVRVAAQLVDARSDAPVWSQTYDRTLDDLFATQEDIASSVANRLELSLSTGDPQIRSTDPKAFALYLQARHVRRLASADGYEIAADLLRQALAVDPNYAPAWIALASTYVNQVNNGLLPYDSGFDMAREAALQGLAIDSHFAPAYDLLGWVAMDYDNDLAQAAEYFAQALAIDATNPGILGNVSALLTFLGRDEDAVALQEYLVARNPVDAISHMTLGLIYLRVDRYDDARQAFSTALRLSPDYIGAHYRLGLSQLFKGDALAAREEFAQEPDDEYRVKGLALAAYSLGDRVAFDSRLQELVDRWGAQWPSEIAHVQAWAGDVDAAIMMLENEFQKTGRVAPNADGPYFYAPLRGNLRFDSLLEKSGTLPAQLAAIEFSVPLPNRSGR